jgi:hypothetical protein
LENVIEQIRIIVDAKKKEGGSWTSNGLALLKLICKKGII